MSRETDSAAESQITADPDTVRAWGEAHHMVPVREERGDEDLDVVPESEADSGAHELSWDEFATVLDREDKVVVRTGDTDPSIDVLDRSEAVGRPHVSRDDVAASLLEGETVESEVTERRVVEHTVVEEATVQSEVTDREVVTSSTVDVELLTTDVDHCTVTRTEGPEETPEAVERFKPGSHTDEAYDVEIAVDETWALTREVVERLTIESRIVDSDVDTTDTVTSDTVRESFDEDGVSETVLQGELVASPEAASRAVEAGHVETQFRDDDVIETHLIRRQTIEEEMLVRKEIAGEVSDAETVSTDAVAHSVVESDIVSEDEYDVDLAAAGTGATGAMADTDETGAMADTDESMASTESTASTTGADRTVTPTADDEGKTVVNSAGDEIGMVTDVEDGRMYVDPDPSITDRIRTALGWGDHDDDEAYPVDEDDIARIEGDAVVLGVDRET